jgi:ArsR family transcriptional regulator
MNDQLRPTAAPNELPATSGAEPSARSELAELARALQALGHPARLRILTELAGRDSCVCGEIVRIMPLAQATVSQHLKVLKEAGLIRGTIDGRRSCYCIDRPAVARLRRRLDALLGTWAGPEGVGEG